MIHNIKPVDFNTFFVENIQKDIIDYLYTYKLIDNNKINLRNAETRRIVHYFTLYRILKKVGIGTLTPVNDRIVIVIQPYIINPDIEICNYCNVDQLKNHMKLLFGLLNKSYPNKVIQLKKFMDLESPDTLEFLFMKSNSYSEQSSRKLKELVKNEGLKLPAY